MLKSIIWLALGALYERISPPKPPTVILHETILDDLDAEALRALREQRAFGEEWRRAVGG